MTTVSEVTRRRRFTFDKSTVLLYLVLVGVHAMMGLVRGGPYIFADETGYLMAARHLAGGPLSALRASSFYHVGYSIFLVPAARVGSPAGFYTAVMMTNAVLLSGVFLVLVAFLRRVVGLEAGRARLLAFVASLYPPFLLLSTVARSENLLIPLFAFAVLALHGMLTSRSWVWGVAFGASVALLYAAHQRMLPVLPVAILAVGWLWRRREIAKKTAAASVGAFGVVLAAGILLNVRVNVLGYSSGRRWSRVFRLVWDLGLDGVRWFFFEAVGQLWYLSVATMGLFLLGLVGVVRLVRDRRDPARRVTSWFLILAGGGLFAMSVLFMMVPARSGAGHRVYGRYNEAFLALFLAIGLDTLGKLQWKRVLQIGVVMVGLTVLLGVLLPLGPAAASLRKGVTSANVLSIVPALRLDEGKLHIAGITFAGAVAMITLLFAARRNRFLALGLTVVVFVGVTADVYLNTVLVADRRYRQLEQMAAAVERTGADEVAYDVTHKKSAGYYGYQFWLDRTEIKLFRSANVTPPSRYVISAREWPEGSRCDARRLFVDPEFDQALWETACPPSLSS